MRHVLFVETTGPPAEAVNHQRRQARVVGWPAGVVRCDLPQRPVALAAHVTTRDVAFASRGTFTGSQEMQDGIRYPPFHDRGRLQASRLTTSRR
jgi:hypothetical protein